MEMETLVVASHQRNRLIHKYCGNGLTKFDSFGSEFSAKFSGLSCRTFQSGEGLLETPLKSISTSVTKSAFSASLSPKTPSPCFSKSRNGSKSYTKSNSIAIPVEFNFDNMEGFNFSERWAGPAYSNSPPPSSLPLPKFSLPPKRTVSLEFPALAPEIDMNPMAKSAPATPTRGRNVSPCDLFDSADSATRTLRRILNLDVTLD